MAKEWLAERLLMVEFMAKVSGKGAGSSQASLKSACGMDNLRIDSPPMSMNLSGTVEGIRSMSLNQTDDS